MCDSQATTVSPVVAFCQGFLLLPRHEHPVTGDTVWVEPRLSRRSTWMLEPGNKVTNVYHIIPYSGPKTFCTEGADF